MKKYLTLIIISCFLGFANLSFSQTNENNNNDTIRAYDISEVEEIPIYVGGYKEMYNFIYKNIKIPSRQKEIPISTKVQISFSVERDGSLSNFKVVKSIDQLIDEEVIRVIKSMPKWNPGKIRGTAVKVEKVVIPILIHFG